MDQINSEMHCHNSFSNFHQAAHDTPYDSSVGIAEQLDRSLHLGLDALFVTNHNTLSGYEEMVRYQADHDKYARIRILPAEEITTDEGAHVIAYGIHEEIRPGLSLEETIDEIRRQDGVSSAPHPFGLLDALREKAGRCDLVEVFNSNNLDVIANARAAEFAHEHGITGVAGSDSHVISTLGRCTNVIEAENSLDGILDALRHGRVSIRDTGYASARETMEYFRYKVDNSAEYIREYVGEFYPRSRWIFSVLLGLFNRSPESYLWVLLLRLGMLSMRRISKKVNFEGLDPGFMKRRSLPEMLRASL